MIEKCADIMADWLANHDAIKSDDKELYKYALYSIFLSLLPLLLAVGFGISMRCVGQSVMIIIPFVILRKFSGGYHAKHSWTCMTGSCLLLLLCIRLSFHIQYGWTSVSVAVVAGASLIYLSPIDNENRVLSDEEHHLYKWVTAVLVVILLLADVLFLLCGLHTCSSCISIGIILTSGLQYPCVLSKLRQRIEKKLPKKSKKCRLTQEGLKL